MGKSKRDLAGQKSNSKARIEELEEKVKLDPLKKTPGIHEELEKFKAQLKKEG